ncbi:hypothetical protein SKPI104516_11395 [Skermania piniformis]
MSSVSGRTISVTLVKPGSPDCAPVVKEILRNDDGGFRWAPQARTDGPPVYSVTVPNDGVYALGAVCRDGAEEYYAQATPVVVGDAPASGPLVSTLPWVKPFPELPGVDRAVAATVTSGNEPCGVEVTELNYVGAPFRFSSSRPEDFVPPHSVKVISVLPPRGGVYMTVGTCGSYSTWPPQFASVPG